MQRKSAAGEIPLLILKSGHEYETRITKICEDVTTGACLTGYLTYGNVHVKLIIERKTVYLEANNLFYQ